MHQRLDFRVSDLPYVKFHILRMIREVFSFSLFTGNIWQWCPQFFAKGNQEYLHYNTSKH